MRKKGGDGLVFTPQQRLFWPHCAFQITLAPFDNLPLVVDGTHFALRETVETLRPVHRAMIETIIKSYCMERL